MKKYFLIITLIIAMSSLFEPLFAQKLIEGSLAPLKGQTVMTVRLTLTMQILEACR